MRERGAACQNLRKHDIITCELSLCVYKVTLRNGELLSQLPPVTFNFLEFIQGRQREWKPLSRQKEATPKRMYGNCTRMYDR